MKKKSGIKLECQECGNSDLKLALHNGEYYCRPCLRHLEDILDLKSKIRYLTSERDSLKHSVCLLGHDVLSIFQMLSLPSETIPGETVFSLMKNRISRLKGILRNICLIKIGTDVYSTVEKLRPIHREAIQLSKLLPEERS